MLKETPQGYFEHTNEIIFANSPSSAGFNVNGMFAIHEGKIFIYPLVFNEGTIKASKTFWHEIGHAYVKNLFSQQELFPRWKLAVIQDGDFITDYARTNLDEDFAETIAFYIQTNGGLTKERLRLKFKNRFEILDEIFINSPELSKKLKTYVKIRMGAKGAFVLGTGYGVYYYFDED